MQGTRRSALDVLPIGSRAPVKVDAEFRPNDAWLKDCSCKRMPRLVNNTSEVVGVDDGNGYTPRSTISLIKCHGRHMEAVR